jgi:DNA-binding ferritin-like protein
MASQEQLVACRGNLCNEYGDVATARPLENWSDEAQKHAWFLFEARRT